MSTEKDEALVIRLADFSESSKVVTLFARKHGKVAGLAKGAKRLKGPFEAALDLLSQCRIVFLRKSSGALDLLTEAQLIKRFQPAGRDLNALYGGYYVAELLDGLTEAHDPHPELYDAAIAALALLATDGDPRIPILQFELQLLSEIGQLPDFEACSVCHRPIVVGEQARYWVSQGSLLCTDCGRPEYQHTQMHSGTIALLRTLLEPPGSLTSRLTIAPQQFRELRHLLTAAISHVLERRPKMLAMLKF